MGECKTCRGARWVCEWHQDKPWDEKLPGGCECGAGAPCPECQPEVCDNATPILRALAKREEG